MATLSLNQEKKDAKIDRIMLKEKKGFLNQERKDVRMGRIMLKEKKGVLNLGLKKNGNFVFEPGKEGCKD